MQLDPRPQTPAPPPIDMTYSFMSDEEPTEEQLEELMRGIADKVKMENEMIIIKMQEMFEIELLNTMKLLENKNK